MWGIEYGICKSRIPVNRIALINFSAQIIRPVPRKTPIATREKEIGARLRAARVGSGIHLAAFARKIRVNVGTLASYEHGRNPVPYLIAAKIAEITNTCERWLATGKLPKQPFFGVKERVEKELFPELFPDRKLFSEIYDIVLSDEFEIRFERVAKRKECTIAELTYLDFPGKMPLFSTSADVSRFWLQSQLERAGTFAGLLTMDVLNKYLERFSKLNDRYFGMENLAKHLNKDDKEEASDIKNIFNQIRAKVLKK